jgi:hypothetical protein
MELLSSTLNMSSSRWKGESGNNGLKINQENGFQLLRRKEVIREWWHLGIKT